MRWLGLVPLCGCHLLFQLEPVAESDAGEPDADAEAPHLCDAHFDHFFPGPTPCMGWGHEDVSGGATLEEHDGLFTQPLLALRPDTTRTAVVAQYSSDGMTWTQIGDLVPTTVTATAYFAVGGGYNMTQDTGTGRAVFKRLTVCR